jgi:hypothetical protein
MKFIPRLINLSFLYLSGAASMTAAELLAVAELANGVRQRYGNCKPFMKNIAHAVCEFKELNIISMEPISVQYSICVQVVSYVESWSFFNQLRCLF